MISFYRFEGTSGILGGSGLEQFPCFLFFCKFFSGLISKSDETVNAFHFCGLPIEFFLSFDDRFFMFRVVLIVNMVEFIHLMGCPMRIVPYKLLRLVELLCFQDLLLDRIGGMRQDRFQVMFLNG